MNGIKKVVGMSLGNSKISAPILLAASPQMKDSLFQKAVILLLEHDKDGAIGFVVNNQSSMTLKEVVSFEQMDIPNHIPVWNAGPVDSGSGFVLHNQSCDYFEKQIAPGVALSSSQESLKKLIQNEYDKLSPASNLNTSVFDQKGVLYPFRLLVGYAGWGAHQLDEELFKGSWIQAPLSKDILFNSGCEDMWAKTLQSVGINKISSFSSQEQNQSWLH